MDFGGLFEMNKGEIKGNAEIVKNSEGQSIVKINSIRFQGKRNVNWDEVKTYLASIVGEIFEIEETKDLIYIGNDLPDEYTGSRYTHKLMGTLAKAKANATQGISQMIEIATKKRYRENLDQRHVRNAKFGWYRYDSRFALPVYDEKGKVERYNTFKGTLLIRHSADGKMYLYDIVDIKKETSNSLGL